MATRRKTKTTRKTKTKAKTARKTKTRARTRPAAKARPRAKSAKKVVTPPASAAANDSLSLIKRLRADLAPVLAKRIRDTMTEKKVSAAAMAKKLEVGHSQVQQWVDKKDPIVPSAGAILGICLVLGCTPNQLLQGK